MAAYQDLKGVRTVALQLATIVLSLSRLVGLGVVAWVMSPKLAFIGLVALPLGMLPAYWLGHRITRAARRQRDATATLHDSFLQLSSGIRVIKVNGAEGRALDRARDLGQTMYQAAVRQAQNSSLARLFLEFVAGMGLIAVLVVGARDQHGDQPHTGDELKEQPCQAGVLCLPHRCLIHGLAEVTGAIERPPLRAIHLNHANP